MGYLIKRGEQTFGPYALTDLQRYVQSGNVLLDDLAQSEGLTDWVPVRQILGDIPAPIVSTTTTAVTPQVELVPLPPNLHWALLLVLNILTSQIFNLFNIANSNAIQGWGATSSTTSFTYNGQSITNYPTYHRPSSILNPRTVTSVPASMVSASAISALTRKPRSRCRARLGDALRPPSLSA